MAKIADFGLSRGEEVYVKKTMVSAGGAGSVSEFVNLEKQRFHDQPAEGPRQWEDCRLGG